MTAAGTKETTPFGLKESSELTKQIQDIFVDQNKNSETHAETKQSEEPSKQEDPKETVSSNSTTEIKKCSVCHEVIPASTDDLTKINFDLYLKDGYCEKCRRLPERRALYDSCCNQTFHIPLDQKSALEQLALDPNIEVRFNIDVHRSVKFDDAVIEDNKAAGLSAYVDPFSVSHKSTESGCGKTYVTTTTFSYFPEENIITVATKARKLSRMNKAF